MSSVPKPPGPPPPPPPQLGDVRNSSLFNNAPNNGEKDHEGFAGSQGSLGRTEIREITEEKFLDEVSNLINTRLLGRNGEPDGDHVKLVVTVPLRKAILQNGPMCGIVALTEALHILHEEETFNPKEILEEAIKMGYTKQGEMFSVTAMLSLAEKFGNCRNARILNTKDDLQQFDKVITHILEGWPVLVPYDADYNHSPSLRKGHAAHWAVINGLACYIPSEKSETIQNNTPEVFNILRSSPSFIFVKPSSNIETGNSAPSTKELLELFSYDSLFVLAHQGKSFHTALWKFKDLMESNQNLEEIAPKILANKSEYICENIVDGLCSKILLLK